MIRKTLIALAAAATLAVGFASASEAKTHINIGIGLGGFGGGYGYGYGYGPSYVGFSWNDGWNGGDCFYKIRKVKHWNKWHTAFFVTKQKVLVCY